MSQVDAMFTQTMAQLTQGQTITPKIQKEIDDGHAEMKALLKEMLDWTKLEAMYVRVYQRSFTQKEVDDMIAMYQTPAGQTLLNKVPLVMQNTMGEMQQIMQPIIERLRQKQQQIAADIQRSKTGG
jgi:hypothetical protein